MEGHTRDWTSPTPFLQDASSCTWVTAAAGEYLIPNSKWVFRRLSVVVSNNYYEGFGKSLYPQNYLNYIIIPPASLFLPFPGFVFLCLVPPSYTARQTWTQIRHFSAFLSRVPQTRLDASQGVICLTEPIITPNPKPLPRGQEQFT